MASYDINDPNALEISGGKYVVIERPHGMLRIATKSNGTVRWASANDGLVAAMVREIRALRADHTDSEKQLIDTVNEQADRIEQLEQQLKEQYRLEDQD